jgi:hypothetical protein
MLPDWIPATANQDDLCGFGLARMVDVFPCMGPASNAGPPHWHSAGPHLTCQVPASPMRYKHVCYVCQEVDACQRLQNMGRGVGPLLISHGDCFQGSCTYTSAINIENITLGSNIPVYQRCLSFVWPSHNAPPYVGFRSWTQSVAAWTCLTQVTPYWRRKRATRSLLPWKPQILQATNSPLENVEMTLVTLRHHQLAHPDHLPLT